MNDKVKLIPITVEMTPVGEIARASFIDANASELSEAELRKVIEDCERKLKESQKTS